MSESFKATTIQHALIDATRRVDIIRGYQYRDTEYAVLARELIPAAREIAGEVVELVGRVNRHYSSSDRAVSPAEVVSRKAAAGDEILAIADVCAVGSAEIQERLVRLGEVEGSSDELVLTTAAMAALGSLRRLTIVLENAVAEREGLTAALSAMDEVERALEIRRVFVDLRRAIRPADSPSAEQVSVRLRDAAGVIADLFGADIYAELRASDRIQLHRLQDRVLAWLGGADDFDPERGRELFDDLATFIELLGQINHRLELVEHDREVIGAALRELESEAPGEVPDRLLEVFATLLGRDDGIDALLAGQVTASAGWRPALAEALLRIGEVGPVDPQVSDSDDMV